MDEWRGKCLRCLGIAATSDKLCTRTYHKEAFGFIIGHLCFDPPEELRIDPGNQSFPSLSGFTRHWKEDARTETHELFKLHTAMNNTDTLPHPPSHKRTLTQTNTHTHEHCALCQTLTIITFSSPSSVLECVLPDPVCPYAKMVPLYPWNALSSSGRPRSLNTSRWSVCAW